MKGRAVVVLVCFLLSLLAAVVHLYVGGKQTLPLLAIASSRVRKLKAHDSRSDGIVTESDDSTSTPTEDGEGSDARKKADEDDKHKVSYDENGFHLHGHDFVAKAIHPSHLQPFYVMPVFFGTKLLFTMLVFGLSLSFKEPKEDWRSKLASIGKPIGGILFILMAINGYRADYGRITEALEHSDSSGKNLAFFTVLWLTSPNYVATRAIWNGLRIDDPSVLLQLKPKYLTVPGLAGIPLVPGHAKWLDPLKHIYALLLLPYFVPYLLFQAVSGILYTTWCISNKCVIICANCAAMGKCCCSCLGVVLSLCLWSWARACLSYWWGLVGPFFYLTLMQVWATGIAPLMFTTIYGIFIGASSDNLLKGLLPGPGAAASGNAPVAVAPPQQSMEYASLEASPPSDATLPEQASSDTAALAVAPASSEQDAAQELTRRPLAEAADSSPGEEYESNSHPLGLDADDVQKLIKLNREKLRDDFEYALLDSGADGYSSMIDDTTDLEDTKMKIFKATLTNMSSIILEQLSTLFIVRALYSSTYEEYIAAIYRTISERKIVLYLAFLREVVGANADRAINAFWLLI